MIVRLLNFLFIIFIASIIEISCNDTEFSMDKPKKAEPKEKKIQIVENDNINNITAEPSEQNLEITFESEQEDVYLDWGCDLNDEIINTKIPVGIEPRFIVRMDSVCPLTEEVEEVEERKIDLLFLLDASYSMDSNIAVIRDNIISLLKGSVSLSDPRVGMIAFTDIIKEENIFGLTDQVEVFQSKLDEVIGNISNESNDRYEAGLLALQKGLELLQEDILVNQDRVDAEKVVLLITDNPSHNGGVFKPVVRGNPSRGFSTNYRLEDDFSLDKTVSDFGAFFNNYDVNNFRFFYSAYSIMPEVAQIEFTYADGNKYSVDEPITPGQTSALAQFHELHKLIFPEGDSSLAFERGGSIGFPLTEEKFKGFFDLITHRYKVDKTCYVQEANILLAEQTHDLEMVNLQESLDLDDNQEIINNFDLPEDILKWEKGKSEEPLNGEYMVNITSCCVEKKDDASNCSSSQIKTRTFKVSFSQE